MLLRLIILLSLTILNNSLYSELLYDDFLNTINIGRINKKRSADIGLRADGVPAAENPDEVIKASQRVHEKLDEVDLSKTTVVNLFGSTALTLAGQLEQTPRVLSSIKHRMKALGRSSEEIELAQQQAKELMQNPDVAEVIEMHEATLQEVEQEVQKLEKNLERLEQKHEELAASDVLKAGSAGAESIQTPLETLQAQLEHMDLSTPEGQSLQYHIAAIDHDQKVNTLSRKLLLKTAETVEKFESFLEKNPNLAKTMRYGVEGINGVLMATGVKGLLTSGLPKALVALGFGEALSTASSWAGGKVEGIVADVATSESEAQRFMKALKTCAETAGVVVGVKIATKTAKSLKASKIQSPVIKDALSERPIIKDGKVWLGDKELGPVNRNLKLHKNDNRFMGKTHVYQITDQTTGEIWKIGESARGVNDSGLSKRAEAQARKLRKETAHRFETKVLETFEGKAAARAHETELIKSLRAAGHKLPGNKGVH